MPSRKEVDFIADRLVASSKPVSLRAVIPLLRSGGSFRDVGPLLAAWKVERGYKRRLVKSDLPESLQGELVGFVRSVWDAALADAAERLVDEREGMEAERVVNEELRNEALGSLDGLALQNSALRDERDRLALRVRELEDRIEALDVLDFWERVMREVALLLPVEGGKGVAEVIAGLPQSLHREAERYRLPITPDEIEGKMAARAFQGRDFVRSEDGSYLRRHPSGGASSGTSRPLATRTGRGGVRSG